MNELNKHNRIEDALVFLRTVTITDQNILVAVAHLLSALAMHLYQLIYPNGVNRNSLVNQVLRRALVEPTTIPEVYHTLKNIGIEKTMFLLRDLSLPYPDYNELLECLDKEDGEGRFEAIAAKFDIDAESFAVLIRRLPWYMKTCSPTITIIEGIHLTTSEFLQNKGSDMSLSESHSVIKDIEYTINHECYFIHQVLLKKLREESDYTPEVRQAVVDAVMKCGFIDNYIRLNRKAMRGVPTFCSIFDNLPKGRVSRILGMLSIEPIKEVILNLNSKDYEGSGESYRYTPLKKTGRPPFDDYFFDSYINRNKDNHIDILHSGLPNRGYLPLKDNADWKHIVEQLPLDPLKRIITTNPVYKEHENAFSFEEYVGVAALIGLGKKYNGGEDSAFPDKLSPQIQRYTEKIGEVISAPSDDLSDFAYYNIGEPVMDICIQIYQYYDLYGAYRNIFDPNNESSEEEKIEEWGKKLDNAPNGVVLLWNRCCEILKPTRGKSVYSSMDEISDPMYIVEVGERCKLFGHWKRFIQDGLVQIAIRIFPSHNKRYICSKMPCWMLWLVLGRLEQDWERNSESVFDKIRDLPTDNLEGQLLTAMVDIMLLLNGDDRFSMLSQKMSDATRDVVKEVRDRCRSLIECEPSYNLLERFPYFKYNELLGAVRYEYLRNHKDQGQEFPEAASDPIILSCLEYDGTKAKDPEPVDEEKAQYDIEDEPSSAGGDGQIEEPDDEDQVPKEPHSGMSEEEGLVPSIVYIRRNEGYLKEVYDEFKGDFLAPEGEENRTSLETFLHYLGYYDNYMHKEDAIYFHGTAKQLYCFVKHLLGETNTSGEKWENLSSLFRYKYRGTKWKKATKNTLMNGNKFKKDKNGKETEEWLSFEERFTKIIRQ